ncbi:hypothetical protein H6F86_25975 [Phormidium sp. FACHB-592]|uniref:Uncharacterized protein n=1 Tax=Stenomitos frigidus AS-A4 TaxID=2933935 RepID=A0ABV0KVI1_9CYAN|nr:hypothetical protein [Phormidium sp. FACHB-592]MBD2077264.1 hypothetical protein [Phormidium sp. FACHB-592]
MTHNGTTPQIDVDPPTGRPIAAVLKAGGGTCIWYADGQLPVVRHVVEPAPKTIPDRTIEG